MLSDIELNSTHSKEVSMLAESISEYGLISPIILSNKEGRYFVIEGSNRLLALQSLGIDKVIAVITDRDDADECRVMSALTSRGIVKYKYSEVAEILWQYYDSIKSQGKRSDLENAKRYSSIEVCSRMMNTSATTVSRYLRLHYLCDSLKEVVDNEVISFRVAVNLSYLDKSSQEIVAGFIREGKIVTLQESEWLRQLSKTGELNVNSLSGIFEEKSARASITLDDICKKYALNYLDKRDALAIIDEALGLYFNVTGNKSTKVHWY